MKYLRKSQMPFYALGFYALASMNTAQASISEEAETYCNLISQQAELVMTVRQMNTPMRDAMALSTMEIVRNMTVEAYDTPRYNSEKVQQDVINDFGNKYYQACYNAAKEAEVNYED